MQHSSVYVWWGKNALDEERAWWEQAKPALAKFDPDVRFEKAETEDELNKIHSALEQQGYQTSAIGEGWMWRVVIYELISS